MAFRSEADVVAWVGTQDLDIGATVPFETLGKLSRRWYAGRLSDHWRPFSARKKQDFFREVGLQGPFWEVHQA